MTGRQLPTPREKFFVEDSVESMVDEIFGVEDVDARAFLANF